MTKKEAQPYALCEMCEWDVYADTDDEAQIIMVLHVLMKHPEQYHADTGKDPQEESHRYRVQIRYYRDRL